jgi:hypothetical protein
VRIIPAIVFLFISLQVAAQQSDTVSSAINIYGFSNKLIVTNSLSCFIDTLKKSNISEVPKENFSAPLSSFVDLLNSDPLHHIFWVKFSLKNISDTSLLLHIYCGTLDYTDLYFISNVTWISIVCW